MKWTALVTVGALALAATPVHADVHGDAPATHPSARRRAGTKIAWVGVTGLLLGAAAEGTAAGLSDHPSPQRGFAIAGGVSAGLGAVGLAIGLYLRATSPAVAPDAISLDPIRSRHRAERRVGIVLTGLGAIATSVGIAHAVGAHRDSSLADAQCPNGVCNADGARLQRRSHILALAAEMLIGPGVIGMAGGIVMYRSAPDSPQLVPVVAPEQVGLAVVGSF